MALGLSVSDQHAKKKNNIYILTKQTVLLQSEPWSLLQLLFLT